MLQTDQAVSTAGGAIAGVAVVAQPMVPVLGVPLAVLLAACAGALIGLGHAKPGTWAPFMSVPEGGAAKRVFYILLRASGLTSTLIAIAVLSAWAVMVAPHVPMLTWTSAIPQLPFAGFLAAGGQILFPKILGAAGRYIDNAGAPNGDGK